MLLWRGLVAVGVCSSVVRALAAQASDLGSIPGEFPVLFHIPFSACVSINTLLIIHQSTYIEPSKNKLLYVLQKLHSLQM